jgi:hypothetical protein
MPKQKPQRPQRELMQLTYLLLEKRPKKSRFQKANSQNIKTVPVKELFLC